MKPINQLIARILLGHIFVLSGVSKISVYEGTQGYMDAMGVPGLILPAVILLELAAGLAVIVGWQTRLAAYALSGFSIMAAIIFHSNIADQMQMIMLMKNFAISGGLLLLASHGAGTYSVDYFRSYSMTNARHA